MPLIGTKPSFMPRHWMGSQESIDTADWVMVGMPYDGTTSYRPGTRFGPEAMRAASWGLETYSPKLDRDLEAVRYFDAGELDIPIGNRDAVLDMIYGAAQEVLAQNKRWFGIGGEHLVTYPAMRAYAEKYPDLGILHFDAHADLRNDYLGEKFSHATVLRRCVELISPDRLVQVGIRSGPREEFDWMRANGTLVERDDQVAAAYRRLSGRPVYLTIDLDVLDPGVLPGTGTPEPGGFSFNELIDWLRRFEGLDVVGADVVELAPTLDPSSVSTAAACKVVRESLLLFGG